MQSAAVNHRTVRIVLAEENEAQRHVLSHALERHPGYKVLGKASAGPTFVDLALAHKPEVVVFDVHLPQLNGLDALRKIREEHPVAAVALTIDRDPEVLRKAAAEPIHGLLVRPVEEHLLVGAVEVALARSDQLAAVAAELDRLTRSLEGRKLVERAKGVLMRRHRWTEADAFRRLQRGAMNRRTTMAELAKQIIDGKEIDL